MADRVHEFTAALLDSLARQMILIGGLPRSTAEKVSEVVVDYVLDEFGGENIYIPRNISGRARARNRKIYEEWSGNNHEELAKKYNITRQRVYAIIKEERQRIFAEKQADLFGNLGGGAQSAK
jgi:mor transcription activator family protein